MSDTIASEAGRLRTPGVDAHGSTGRWPTYAVGFVLAAGLTAASFGFAVSHWLTPASLVAALIVLAIAQMIVHLVFFLHMHQDDPHRVILLGRLEGRRHLAVHGQGQGVLLLRTIDLEPQDAAFPFREDLHRQSSPAEVSA